MITTGMKSGALNPEDVEGISADFQLLQGLKTPTVRFLSLVDT